MGKAALRVVVVLALAIFAGRAMAQDSYDFGVDEVRGGLFFHSVDHAPPQPPGPEPDVSARLTLLNPLGLHARPAAQIATAVGGLAAYVAVEAGDRTADAASPLELLTLGAVGGVEITVSATGADAARAVEAVRQLVVAGFGELEAG